MPLKPETEVYLSMRGYHVDHILDLMYLIYPNGTDMPERCIGYAIGRDTQASLHNRPRSRPAGAGWFAHHNSIFSGAYSPLGKTPDDVVMALVDMHIDKFTKE